jgi:alcohol dehydrogenase YqhD (iron-dependent ADH family)
MEDFVFQAGTKFVMQNDADLLCGEEAVRYSDKVLFVHYGDAFMNESGLRDRISGALVSAGLIVTELAGVKPNPDIELVRKGVALCRESGAGVILAVGGGSVIDTAKAISIGACYDGDVWDFYTGSAIPQEALPVGAVMTLPATGSEGSNGSVIKNYDEKVTRDVMSEVLRPRFVLMNPLLTLNIPRMQTAYGIIDMFTHVLERYFSDSVDVVLTDHLCEGVMKSIVVNSGRLAAKPDDRDIRAEFMWTSVIAHNGLLATGRNQDWGTHAIAAQVSALCGAAHGAALSVLFPAWARYVYPSHIARFAQLAERVFGVEMNHYHPEETAAEGVERLREFFSRLGGPSSLSEIGVNSEEEADVIAKRVGDTGWFAPLKEADVREILVSAL